MSAEKISIVFRRNFARTLLALGVAFIFTATLLIVFFGTFGITDARNQAQSILKTYRNNLVSILILNEEQALDVAIDRMNEASTLVKFRRDLNEGLRYLEFRENIETSGQKHGSLIYSVNPMSSFNLGVLLASLGGLAVSFLGVWLSFRRAQQELTIRVSEPLENLSEAILQVHGQRESKLDFPEIVDTGALEIRELQHAFQRYSQQLLETQAILSAARQDQAIASMTQMLAHDVRKPFSMFKAVVEIIEQCDSPAEMKKITQDFIPEVNRAMSTVTGLLQDVLEVSSQASPILKDTSPIALLEKALLEIFAYQGNTDVSLCYDLKHTTFVSVDVSKVMRVFNNICGNAIQAMNGKGSLWFRTRDVIFKDVKFVEFVIGNSGSFIAEEDRGRLFDAFFTKNKAGGTGLGLAIAQKVVKTHGGTIRCHSILNTEFPSGMVEFIFTLPSCEGRRDLTSKEHLPANSKELVSRNVTVKRLNDAMSSDDTASEQILASLVTKIRNSGRRLRVLMVDDELIYRSAIQAHVASFKELSELVELSFASGSNDISDSTFDGAILDADLGSQSLDGFQLAKELRINRTNFFLCIHSNRTFADDFRKSLETGADAFLPKPMSAPHLLRFLAQCADRAGFK